MATNKRTYPNDYFAWYNDEDRIAIICEDTTSTSGERTQEKYDTFQGTGNLSGNITASSTAAGAFVNFTSASHGLTVGDRVEVSGTTSYDGNHAVTVVDDANTFRIAATNSESNEGASTGVTFTSLADIESTSLSSKQPAREGIKNRKANTIVPNCFTIAYRS